MKINIEEKDGYRWAVSADGKILIDTVPQGIDEEWLSSAKESEILIICSDNPYPKCIRDFLDTHPEGRVYAPYYTQFRLTGILGNDNRIVKASDKGRISVGDEQIRFEIVTQAGKAPYMNLFAGEEEIFSGKPEPEVTDPVIYSVPTVVIPYISG